MIEEDVKEKDKNFEIEDEFYCMIKNVFHRLDSRVKSSPGIPMSEMSVITDMVKDLSETMGHVAKFYYYYHMKKEIESEQKESVEAIL